MWHFYLEHVYHLIIWLIVLFSGALVFIVIYNLTNINIAECGREIATVQVLGFYPRETNSYVLRENLILSVIAGILGLLLPPTYFVIQKAPYSVAQAHVLSRWRRSILSGRPPILSR